MVPLLSSTYTVGIETLERLKNGLQLSLGTSKWHSSCLAPVYSVSDSFCPLQFRPRPDICLTGLVTSPPTGGHKLLNAVQTCCSALCLLMFRTAPNMTRVTEWREGMGTAASQPPEVFSPGIVWLSPWRRRCPVLWCDVWAWGLEDRY